MVHSDHGEVPKGDNFWCPKTGRGFHCAYCHRDECEVCFPKTKEEVET